MFPIAIGIHALILLGLSNADTKCSNKGGVCYYTDQYACTEGRYEAGLCSGPWNRKCCIPTDPKCQSRGGQCYYTDQYACSEGQYESGYCSGPWNRKCCVPTALDPKCTAVNGVCQYTTTTCVGGAYRSGLCSGPVNRQCCVKNSYGGDFTKYGDIRLLTPTGKSSGGVAASQAAINYDMTRLNKYKDCMYRIGREFGLHPSLIGALASRESNVGGYINRDPYGWGDYRNGRWNAYGILQCDVYTSGLGRGTCTQYNWDSCEHMRMMIDRVLLRDKYTAVTKPGHPGASWPKERQLQAAVAAYNFGAGNVRTWSGLDRGTANNDYSNDVIARAQYLINSKGWD